MVDIAISYLGMNTQIKRISLSSYFFEEITRNFQLTYRNIAMDNWFISIPLTDKHLKIPINFPVVGTIWRNKLEILPELLELRSQSVGTSMCCLDQAETVLSYKT
ncbi:hypothetical protein TNCT_702721 [Trichonephila clavata]|uniref:PiggyBac transposable element-derived protein domain-containing protein n=1 Tax=Trichonephila clavata TaxID=2740835 RepID=A0A8X6HVR0_TRICU|nr:hypothetical protein TNCT_702721 [Trichonephila clavata]